MLSLAIGDDYGSFYVPFRAQTDDGELVFLYSVNNSVRVGHDLAMMLLLDNHTGNDGSKYIPHIISQVPVHRNCVFAKREFTSITVESIYNRHTAYVRKLGHQFLSDSRWVKHCMGASCIYGYLLP